MATISHETPILDLTRPARPTAVAHQSRSWGLLWRWCMVLRRWGERRGQRRALAALIRQPHLLHDIGLTRAQALRESGKPFWRR